MDDLSGKINDLLSDPESMQRIKSLASMLSGSAGGSGGGTSAPQDDQQQESYSGGNPLAGFAPTNMGQSPQGGGTSDFNIDPAMLMKISGAMQMMNRPDPRVDLLMALRENLSIHRQKKVDDAVKILRLLSLMPMLKEQGIFDMIGL